MTLRDLVRVLLRRWYVTAAGLIMSLTVAGITFALIPPKYTSTGVAVLVQPKQPGTVSSINPLLSFSESLNTTALILSQAVDTPAVDAELGLKNGADSFTVKNVGSIAISGATNQPFIYVTAQSSTPQKSIDIVVDVMSIAREALNDRQAALRVEPRNQINLENVVDATTPKPVTGLSLAASGSAFILGMVITTIVACVWNRLVVARQKRRIEAFASRALANGDLENGDSRVQVDVGKRRE